VDLGTRQANRSHPGRPHRRARDPSSGGWSLLIDGATLGLSGEEMSRRLFDHTRIAATPMTGGGEVNGVGWIRLVYANEPIERLRGIGDRVRHALGI